MSTSSISVKSADGFTKTYQVTSSTLVDAQRDGIGSVKDGHQVSVLATVSGGRATATSILDLSCRRQVTPRPAGATRGPRPAERRASGPGPACPGTWPGPDTTGIDSTGIDITGIALPLAAGAPQCQWRGVQSGLCGLLSRSGLETLDCSVSWGRTALAGAAQLLDPRPSPGLRPATLAGLASRISEAFGGRPVNPDSPTTPRHLVFGDTPVRFLVSTAVVACAPTRSEARPSGRGPRGHRCRAVHASLGGDRDSAEALGALPLRGLLLALANRREPVGR